MGLFKKKEKQLCPICSKELSAFNKTSLVDDTYICDECADKANDWLYPKFIAESTLEDVKNAFEKLNETKEEKEELLDSLGDYEAYIDILDAKKSWLTPAHTRRDVAQKYKGKWIVEGMCQIGNFVKGDYVTIIHDNQEIDGTIFDCTERNKESIDLSTFLAEHYTDEAIYEGDYVYVFLDLEENISLSRGDRILK